MKNEQWTYKMFAPCNLPCESSLNCLQCPYRGRPSGLAGCLGVQTDTLSEPWPSHLLKPSLSSSSRLALTSYMPGLPGLVVWLLVTLAVKGFGASCLLDTGQPRAFVLRGCRAAGFWGTQWPLRIRVSCLQETTHIRAIMWVRKLESVSQGFTVCVGTAASHSCVSISNWTEKWYESNDNWKYFPFFDVSLTVHFTSDCVKMMMMMLTI